MTIRFGMLGLNPRVARRVRIGIILLFGLLVTATTGHTQRRVRATASPVMYAVTDLGGINPQAINNAGQIVGPIVNSSQHWRAVRWHNGVSLDLGTLGGEGSYAYDINDAGQVVGWAHIPGDSSYAHPFVWTPGGADGVPQNPQMKALSIAPSGKGIARGINNVGQIVGEGEGVAVLWNDGPAQILVPVAVLPPLSHQVQPAQSRRRAEIEAGAVLC